MSKNRKQAQEPATAKDILCRKLGLPMTVVEDMSYMEMIGNSQAVIDGCKGILGCEKDKICLSLSKGKISFLGDELEIKALSSEQAVVTGKIITVEFG